MNTHWYEVMNSMDIKQDRMDISMTSKVVAACIATRNEKLIIMIIMLLYQA